MKKVFGWTLLFIAFTGIVHSGIGFVTGEHDSYMARGAGARGRATKLESAIVLAVGLAVFAVSIVMIRSDDD